MGRAFFRKSAKGWVLLAAVPFLCQAQAPLPGGDYSAQVVSLSGQVSVMRDGQPWALSVGDAVKMQQVIVTGPDGNAIFKVSDGSTFEVYPNSNVIFRKDAPNWRDLLDVLVGRVRIQIEHWGGQPNFNRVHTPTAVISVRGTIFDVSVSEDDLSTTISVEEGEVDVWHAMKGGPTRHVNAGETLQVYRDEPLASARWDRGVVAQKVLRGLYDAMYIMLENPRTGGIGHGGLGGGTGSGQKAPPPPPTTLPPPPPSVAPPPPPAP